MKTEHEIAKENIKVIGVHKRIEESGQLANLRKRACLEHKQTLQRWLEFLEDDVEKYKIECHNGECQYCKKITDIKKALEEYEKNGI